MVGNKISLCRDYRLNQYRYNESLLYYRSEDGAVLELIRNIKITVVI